MTTTNEILVTLLIALVPAILAAIPGFLAYLRGRKTDKVDNAEKLTGSALQIVKALEGRVGKLEERNNLLVENERALRNELAAESLKRQQLQHKVEKMAIRIAELETERNQLIEDNRQLLSKLQSK